MCCCETSLAKLLTCDLPCCCDYHSCVKICRAGLLDGPVALVANLLAFGGSSASSLEAQQAGLGAAGVATAVSGKSGPLMELSPAGGVAEDATCVVWTYVVWLFLGTEPVLAVGLACVHVSFPQLGAVSGKSGPLIELSPAGGSLV
jgi:hypothetical protein